MAPHIAEELWVALGRTEILALHPWPSFDEALTVDALVEIPIQIQGKVRAKLNVARGTSEAELETLALQDEKIQQLLEGKTIRKVVVVPDRMVNIVAT
jgi:leucyl-tRNA synthetase